MDAAGLWMNEARRLLDHIETTQMDAIAEAAAICADTIAAGGLVHLFGSGHSRIPAEEMFPRYGSYPGFHPIVELSMTFHTQIVGSNGQRQAMFIEGVEGLAEVILSNFTFGPDDAFIVFSVSGRSAVPVEIAMGARERGMPLIVVTSVAESMAAPPRHPSGTRLLDQGDVVIDLGTPPGDALVEIEGGEARVGPGSTFVFAAVTNELKVQTAALLVERDALPAVLTSASVVGKERSAALFDDAYADHATRLAGVIDPTRGQ
jgi:uncharacterized phosphosugar-binding protein